MENKFVAAIEKDVAWKLTENGLDALNTTFDACVTDNSSPFMTHRTDMTFYDKMKAKYAAKGFKLPEIVFWNVAARQNTYHTQKHTPHVRMVSGQATSVFKSLIDGKEHTPYDFMLEVVYNERYDSVKLG